MQGVDFVFSIAILIMSVIIHEVSHGYAAEALGDPTARYAGRLTLNPVKHLDLFGSFLLPILTGLFGGFIFGWAKPVPYNPYNLKNQRWGPAIVAGAGPFSNILIALVFGLPVRFGYDFLPSDFIQIASAIVLINLVLAVFNLVPIPPLDGSKILFAVLPYHWRRIQEFLEEWGLFFILLFVFFLFKLLLPIVFIIFRLFTGFEV